VASKVPQQPSGERPIDLEHARFDDDAKAETRCASCNEAIVQSYYTAGEKVFCEACKEKLTAPAEGSAFGRLARASLFGLGAAAVGAGIWFAVSSLTGYEFGLIAILVGFMVGTAVRLGSRERGGLRYQFLAVFLTYAAIVSTYVPLIITELNQEFAAEMVQEGGEFAIDEQDSAIAASNLGGMPESQLSGATHGGATPAVEEMGMAGFILGVMALMAFAFALPFLAGIENLIGLLIIGFGLWQAWRINARARLEMSGPFRVSAKVSSKAA
jgi:hypothetical protein